MTKKILGIDPGTITTGYAIIEKRDKIMEVLDFGIWQNKENDRTEVKLYNIFEKVLNIINQFNPSELAIEAPFQGKNIQSMLKLGRVQGIVMVAACSKEMKVFEYSPREIKKTVTGNGNAAKEQVEKMLFHYFPTLNVTENLTHDAYDALSIALCRALQNEQIAPNSKSKSWKDFVSKNSGKIL